MKFGGSSVKDANMFNRVCEIVSQNKDKNPIVVLSAVSKITDLLIKCVEESTNLCYDSYNKIVSIHLGILSDLNLNSNLLEKELTELKRFLKSNSQTDIKVYDHVCFFGERMSTRILAELLTKKEISSEAHISGDIGLITDSNFGNAKILETSYNVMRNVISDFKHIPIITGFGGKDEEGNFTTFSRGGSDYVASLIGCALDVEEIQIWTDVCGILTADPRIVKNGKRIPIISFEEASEFAYFGAEVLHPKTIIPAVKKNIPVRILNTFEPRNSGTIIIREKQGRNFIAISSKENITVVSAKSVRMIEVYGFVSKIFDVFKKYEVSVDMISTSEINVSITIGDTAHLDSIVSELRNFSEVRVSKGNSIICILGRERKSVEHHLADIFRVLFNSGIDVKMVSQSTNEISVGIVISKKDTQKAIEVLHKELVC